MSLSEDPEHAYEASEDSESAAHAAPDNLSLGPRLGQLLDMKMSGEPNAFDSHDDVRMAFENFQRVASLDDFNKIIGATLESLSTMSLPNQNATIARKLESIFASLGNFSKTIASIILGHTSVDNLIAAAYIRATKLIDISVNDQIVLKDHSGLIESLAMIYADIIKFNNQVYEVVQKNDREYRFYTAWTHGQPHIEGIINDLEAHRNTFDDRIYIIEGRHYEDLFLEGIDMCNRTEKPSQYHVISDWLEADEFEQSQVFDSIVSGASKPFFSHHWLLHHPKVKDWRNTSTSPAFLVLEGHPGSGKTVFATQLVATLRALHKESLILYHFCSYAHPSSTEYSMIVKSLILQIYRLCPALVQDFDTDRTGSSIREDILENHFRTMIASPSFQPENPLYVIIDGVDECDDCTQVLLIKLLREIDLPSLKVFVSGLVLSPQAMEEIRNHCADTEVSSISLIDEKARIEGSIRCYAERRLEVLRQDNFQIGVKSSDFQDMALCVAKRADGMFLWARSMLDQLAANKSLLERDKVQAIIHSPPQEIVTYLEQKFEGERSFMRMKGAILGPTAKLAIGWIVNSKEPLTVDGLVDALHMSSDPAVLEPSEIKEFGPQMVNYVHYMVHDEPSGAIHIPLEGVRLYLHHKVATDWVSDIEAIMGRTCIAYLSQNVFKTGPCLSIPDFEDRLESYPLYAYAAKHWGLHASKATDSDLHQILDFLDQGALVRSAYQAMKAYTPKRSLGLGTGVTGLHLAAFFGLETVVREMLKPGHGTSTAKDSFGRTPLDWAVEEKQDAVAKMLRNHDTITTSDRNSYGSNERRARNRTRLHEAAIQGDRNLIVKRLGEGASVDDEDSNGETALNLAFRMRRTEAVNVLIEHSASTTGITAAGLRKMFDQRNSDVLYLAQLQEGKSSLNFLSDSDTAKIKAIVHSTTQPVNERHLFVFNQESANLWEIGWFPQPHVENELDFTDNNFDLAFRDTIVLRYSASFRFPVGESTKAILSDMFGDNPGQARIGVSWVMAQSKNTFSLEPTVHLSNMPQVFIPDQQLRLVIQLIECLKIKWLEVCQGGQNRLQGWRKEIMRESGNDLTLLKRLMFDAQKWAEMRQLLQRHANKTITFGEIYNRQYSEFDALDELKRTVQDLQDSIGKQLDSLDSTYENLIEMESNLISLREAERSNSMAERSISMARSMKRLSWITFIFLPATFSASLFGMNINLLKDNPDWRWFLLVGGICLSLSFTGWLTFKFTSLEDDLESAVTKAFKRRKPHSDAEKATKPTLRRA